MLCGAAKAVLPDSSVEGDTGEVVIAGLRSLVDSIDLNALLRYIEVVSAPDPGAEHVEDTVIGVSQRHHLLPVCCADSDRIDTELGDALRRIPCRHVVRIDPTRCVAVHRRGGSPLPLSVVGRRPHDIHRVVVLPRGSVTECMRPMQPMSDLVNIGVGERVAAHDHPPVVARERAAFAGAAPLTRTGQTLFARTRVNDEGAVRSPRRRLLRALSTVDPPPELPKVVGFHSSADAEGRAVPVT